MDADVAERVRKFHAEHASRQERQLRPQDAALLKVMIDGVNDLDWAAIFASINPDSETEG